MCIIIESDTIGPRANLPFPFLLSNNNNNNNNNNDNNNDNNNNNNNNNNKKKKKTKKKKKKSNGNMTGWSSIRSVIIRVMTKSDDRAEEVLFVYHEYDYRSNWTTRSLITN